jgi:hypothetical protein
MERSQTRNFIPKENQPIKSKTNRLQKTKRQPRKQKLPLQNQQKKSQQKLRSQIIKLAKKPFTTPYPFNEIRFHIEEDLSRERKLCDQIITLLHKWEDSHQMPINGNAVFMHIQSHGVEKVIDTPHALADANTIGDYVMTKYELSEKELEDLHNYIQKQIRYSSTVPSGYCNVLQSPIEPSLINSDTIEYELVSMYMKRYHSRDSGSSSNGQGLNVLFDILRLRKRYFFETLNANTRIPKNSGLDNNFFIKDIHKVSKYIEDKASREYSTKSGVGINNKSFIFSPNEGETDNNLYGIHLFSYDNDELNAQNLSQEPVSQSVFNFGPPPTAIQRILNFFSSNTTTTTTTKPEIIRRIQTKLSSDKHLTLADIFLLGWAIGKKLFIFDPSCNAIENRTNTMETRGFSYTKAQRGEDAARDSKNLLSTGQNIITTQEVDNYGYGSQMSPTPSQSQSQSQMSPTLSRTPSQSQMSSTSWWRGGKKRNTKRRKTNKKSKTKRTRKTRQTRRI